MIRLTLIVLTLTAILFADSLAATWFIKPDGTGDAPTIQAGIDSAVAGDTVSLKNGTYRGDGNRDIDFLGKAIVVRSEFGEPSWCIIDCEGSPTDFHRGFHLHSGEDSTSVLEGLTIVNGYLARDDRGAGVLCENSSGVTLIKCKINDNTIHHEGKGGGMFCSGATLKIDNCEFRGNRTQTMECASGFQYGGGIYADACSLTIKDSFFSNWSGKGGGIYCTNSRLSVSGTTFSKNTALDCPFFPYGLGGGINALKSDVTLTTCFFTGNHAGDTGGAVIAAGTPNTLCITGCVFSGNYVAQSQGTSGGAVSCRDGTFTDCTFFDNKSHDGNGGGVSGQTLVFTECRFERNTAPRPGGGLGGGVSCQRGTFNDCEFIENYASGGGGVWAVSNKSSEFTNCLFAGNISESGGGGVAAMNATFTNCTFSDNRAPYDGAFSASYGPVYAENTILAFNTAFDTLYYSPVTLVCCNVYGNEGGDWVGPLAGQEGINGNFSAHPMFCDPENGDFTLASVSECLPANNDCGVLVGAYGQGCDYAVGVPDDRGVPPTQATLRAYPNPFNPSTTIEYYIPRSGEVTIHLFDVSGRLVTSLVNRHEGQGFHSVTWDGTDLHGAAVSSGVYFVRFESGVEVQTRKIVLLK